MHTPQQHSDATITAHGLSLEEYQKILSMLGREPNELELGIFSVMWSEHCSYKSTRLHLKKFPTKASWVICGPGENAGVIDIGDGKAAIFKMESHNHPSYIEPYQGAATGVGGILRDVFTMGARPIANLNALRFGAIDHPKTPHLVSGVVAGIGGYGNSVGVPTVGGECIFHPCYNGNILVNAMSVGIADQDKIFYSAASAVGAPVVYMGSKTGRDGIHGATMASAEFDDDSEEKRPTVQVGDPFTEKRLIEACLELMQTDAILSIQDMGAAGLTCSSLEMASKGNTGIKLYLDQVPCREANMTPYEMMLSESQERMLMVIKPGKEALAKSIFTKWELDAAIIGEITNTGFMELMFHDEEVARLPVQPLSDEAPVYDRPFTKPVRPQPVDTKDAENVSLQQALLDLLACPDIADKHWIAQQYDSQVMTDTVFTSNAEAALVRIHGSGKALAMTSDCTPRYCKAYPFDGGKQAVAESYRNLSAVGATPLAVTNCLNFGNPEVPEIMGQLVGCIEGIAEACKMLDFPVVSGNVSLYNATNDISIDPTPTIGGVGILNDLTKRVGNRPTAPGLHIYLIGETKGHLGASLFLREVLGKETGPPPAVDLSMEKHYGTFIRTCIDNGLLDACADLSDGGVLTRLAEISIASDMGADITMPELDIPAYAWLFGEDQGRYLAYVHEDHTKSFEAMAAKESISYYNIGETMLHTLKVQGALIDLPVSLLQEAHRNTIPAAMQAA